MIPYHINDIKGPKEFNFAGLNLKLFNLHPTSVFFSVQKKLIYIKNTFIFWKSTYSMFPYFKR